MSLFDANTPDTDPAAESLLVLLHGSLEGAERARARGAERIRTGWTAPAQVRTTGRRTGRLATSRISSAIAS